MPKKEKRDKKNAGIEEQSDVKVKALKIVQKTMLNGFYQQPIDKCFSRKLKTREKNRRKPKNLRQKLILNRKQTGVV